MNVLGQPPTHFLGSFIAGLKVGENYNAFRGFEAKASQFLGQTKDRKTKIKSL